mgnify:CR=1 FL=1
MFISEYDTFFRSHGGDLDSLGHPAGRNTRQITGLRIPGAGDGPYISGHSGGSAKNFGPHRPPGHGVPFVRRVRLLDGPRAGGHEL